MEWTALKFRARPYAAAAALTTAAALAQAVLSQWLTPAAGLSLYMPAVAGSATLGLGPGALAIALSSLADWVLGTVGFAGSGSASGLLPFVVSSMLMVAILSSLGGAGAGGGSPVQGSPGHFH